MLTDLKIDFIFLLPPKLTCPKIVFCRHGNPLNACGNSDVPLKKLVAIIQNFDPLMHADLFGSTEKIRNVKSSRKYRIPVKENRLFLRQKGTNRVVHANDGFGASWVFSSC